MVKLVDVFIPSELATTLQNYYNSINVEKPITQDFTVKLLESLDFAIDKYKQLETDFDTIEKGKLFISTQLKLFGLGLVQEYKNYFDSLNQNLSQIHRQSKFNPLDNENINDAPIRKDDTVYDLGSSMLAATDFIIKNRKITKYFLRVILQHTIRVF